MRFGYTDFQRLVHAVPEPWNRFLGGGRGGGKSVGLAQGIGIRAERYQRRARILYIRKGPYKSLSDITEVLHSVFDQFWGPKRHSLNRSSMQWTIPTGTHFELGIQPDGEEGRRYYEQTYQGRSFTDIYVDEAQQFMSALVIDLLSSNLRGPIPSRMTLGANPGGIGHQWLAQRHVFAGEPFRPYTVETEVLLAGQVRKFAKTWINCPSTYRDNPFNGPDYLTTLALAAGNDLELLRAWTSGDWKIARGAYFAAVIDNPRIKFEWPEPDGWGSWSPAGWKFWLCYDHGSASPAACYVIAKSPGSLGPDGRFYPAGSLLVLDEWVCHREGDLGTAFGWTVPQVAVYIHGLARRWSIPPAGPADDACFAQEGHKRGSIADEYAAEGVRWRKARKGYRAPRMLQIKRMLKAAGNFEEPGLYVSTRCWYFWQTVPFLVHDPVDREVPLKCDTDHGLDAVSYGLHGDEVTAGVLEHVS